MAHSTFQAVSTARGQALAKEYGLNFYETVSFLPLFQPHLFLHAINLCAYVLALGSYARVASPCGMTPTMLFYSPN